MAIAKRTPVNQYVELKRRIKQARLLEPQPVYYTLKIAFTAGLLLLSITCLLLFKHSWFQLLNAVFLAFVTAQIGFIGHDIGHRQIFRSNRLFEISALVTGNLVIGWSLSWWVDKHNRHHAHPNELDVDPDIEMPFLAFTREKARAKKGFLRWMVKYQQYLYLPLELLGWLSFLIFSIAFLKEKKAKHPIIEGLALGIHYICYFGFLFFYLNPWQAILFFIIHSSLFSLYLGSVAAPNHKGMLVSDTENRLDFLHQQILSSRNVKAHPVTDFWYGGLNYQIEHHLFPTIPRNNLGKAQHIVKTFCKEYDIPYHETGFIQSYREIFQHFNDVSAELRTESPA